MKTTRSRRQRGVTLLALLAVVALGASWFLVSKLYADSGSMAASRKIRNAEVLTRAKQALIGYVAAQAVKAGENNPGAMPCPEAPASFNAINGTDGKTNSGGCAGPVVGRFPWRTIGTEQLVDAVGEPLWYVVSAGWSYDGTNYTDINSNSSGQLSVDGVPNAAVALIIAPGPAFAVPTATGCAAWSQARPVTAPPDWRNYLECTNATYPTPDATFATTGPSTSFNDQVMVITAADVLPAIEAAISERIRREILPALQTVYTQGATWGITNGANPVLPFAAPFASPGPGIGTSNYHGATGTYAGLLPFNQMRNCTVSAADPRCTSTVLTYGKTLPDVQTSGGGSIRTQSACSWQGSNFVCIGEYQQPTISVTVNINVANVAGGLRTLNLAGKVSFTAMNDTAGGWGTQTISHSETVTMNANGSLTISVAGGTLPDITTAGWGTYADYVVSIDPTAFDDHALLSSIDPTTGWFTRNEWYRLVYYAVAPSNTTVKVASERSCLGAGPADCLSITTNGVASNNSALLVLAGRSINGATRPSSILGDYLEFGNTKGSFERQTATPAPASMYADTGAANAYNIPVASLAAGTTLQFRALNSNTGTSTLTMPATGSKSLVNPDGSNLAASTIPQNAAVQVLYDGTQFILLKRPFNDRVVAIGSN